MSKKLLIKSFGCQMNVYDSARMADLLLPLGYALTEDAECADMVVLNTCHIREKASEKVYSELGRLKTVKERRGTTIVVAGCVAQAEGQEIQRRQPAVDIVVGPQSYHRLPELIARAARIKGHVLDTEFPGISKFDALPPAQSSGPCAFLTIQEGCDKFCSFCVVPYTRGAENSRPVMDILKEAEQLVSSGARELTLLGQNVNAYRGADRDGAMISLAGLLARLSEITGLERLRYTTSHPRDMDEALIGAHATLDKLMPFLHLPVQSGSDKILAAMNRHYRVAEYGALIERIRAARRDIAVSSDFIVGFPGETESDFQQTLDLVERIGFAQAYSFKYSPRPGTPAAALPQQIPDDVKSERLERLQARLQRSALAFNEAQIGAVLPVLFDRKGRKAGQAIGRSPFLQSVVVEDRAVLGRILPVRITAAGPNSLIGEIVVENEAQCAA